METIKVYGLGCGQVTNENNLNKAIDKREARDRAMASMSNFIELTLLSRVGNSMSPAAHLDWHSRRDLELFRKWFMDNIDLRCGFKDLKELMKFFALEYEATYDLYMKDWDL